MLPDCLGILNRNLSQSPQDTKNATLNLIFHCIWWGEKRKTNLLYQLFLICSQGLAMDVMHHSLLLSCLSFIIKHNSILIFTICICTMFLKIHIVNILVTLKETHLYLVNLFTYATYTLKFYIYKKKNQI